MQVFGLRLGNAVVHHQNILAIVRAATHPIGERRRASWVRDNWLVVPIVPSILSRRHCVDCEVVRGGGCLGCLGLAKIVEIAVAEPLKAQRAR
jgi:hypothetical protein